MKYLFGLLSLVLALAVVSWVMKAQVGAVSGKSSVSAATLAPGTNAAALARQSQALQEQSRQQVTRALQDGADRNARAEP